MSSLRAKTRFRSIPEGRGGTFNFRMPSPKDTAQHPPSNEVLWRIGTKKLKTCVGVYFELSNNRCFLAHINAYVREKRRDQTDDQARDRCWRDCNAEEGEIVKLDVLDELRREAEVQGWTPDDPNIAKSIIVACPEPETDKDDSEKQTGWWAMEAIKEFLKMPVLPFERKVGFVIDRNHDTPTEWLSYDAERAANGQDPPEMSGFVEVEEETREWYVAVPPTGR